MNSTAPSLEDELGDVLEKAVRQARTTHERLAVDAQVDVARIKDAVDYRSELTQAELSRLARVLGLNEVGLNALAQDAYPRADLGGLPFAVFPLRMPFGVGVSNAYLVSTGGEGAVLFDTGASHAELHRAWPSQVQRIDAVFITHYEAEHIGGLDVVLRETGLPFFYGPASGRWPLCKALGEGDLVEIGGLRITAFGTPGHAPEHNCYRVGLAGVSNGTQLFISGDLIFAGSLGGGYYCCERQLKHARRVMGMLGENDVIAPGHGPLSTVGNEKRYNPFLG